MQKIYLLTIMAALASVAVSQLPADVEKYHRACLDESKVSDDELKQFFQNGMRASDATENIKCHNKCMMQKMGIFKDGVFDADAKMKELMQNPSMKGHEAEIKQALNDCKNEKGANECDTSFKITMCLKDFSKPQHA
ncbi:general odorant-binding protein 56h [Ceratitis capitata]|uniref:General odorant-binding protein 56h n=1 Tax=Ceratitis capitata TaxID=7213 RepID=W8BU34_CERCA|nr:general odorant-binding protein 56h [Ceratitis capitata]